MEKKKKNTRSTFWRGKGKKYEKKAGFAVVIVSEQEKKKKGKYIKNNLKKNCILNRECIFRVYNPNVYYGLDRKCN